MSSVPTSFVQRAIPALCLGIAASTAQASSFALIEQGVSGLGNAYAGGAAVAEDAATVFFNPAGMTLLEGSQMVVAGQIVMPQADYSDRGSYVNPGLTGGVPVAGSLTGKDHDSVGETGFVPNLYYVTAMDDWRFGLGINAPFGFATEYDDNWVGRYHALESELKTININPSIAFRVNDQVSLGGGLNVQYLDVRLTNALDFGTICFGAVEPIFGAGTCAGAGVLPLAADGAIEVEGDSWSFGFNLGALVEFSETTRMGAHYRSEVSHDLEGRADFHVPANFQAILNAGLPLFSDTAATSAIDLPQTLSVSLHQQLSPGLNLMGDITWTGWSSFEEIRIEFDNPFQPDSAQPIESEDTLRYALGLSYQPSETWTFRVGAAYDETPVPNAQLRNPRVPDNDRTWLAMGLGYRLSEDMSLDLGYAHLFLSDTRIDETDISTGHTLVGTFDNSVDILSAQFNLNF